MGDKVRTCPLHQGQPTGAFPIPSNDAEDAPATASWVGPFYLETTDLISPSMRCRSSTISWNSASSSK